MLNKIVIYNFNKYIIETVTVKNKEWVPLLFFTSAVHHLQENRSVSVEVFVMV